MTPCLCFLSGGVGGGEILLLAIIVLIFFGPKELPRLFRTFGELSRRLRDAGDEFKRQIEEGGRDLEEGIRRSAEDGLMTPPTDASTDEETRSAQATVADEVDREGPDPTPPAGEAT